MPGDNCSGGGGGVVWHSTEGEDLPRRCEKEEGGRDEREREREGRLSCA